MASIVLDSSAILAMLWAEPGAGIVTDNSASAMISSVNMAEVVTKLLDGRFSEDETNVIVGNLKLDVIPFDESQAVACGMLRTHTRHKGLSLGDRACLALAIQESATVLTADSAWSNLDLGIEIKVIR
jgi:PIN domain nuclease of toxin-antitoxin system